MGRVEQSFCISKVRSRHDSQAKFDMNDAEVVMNAA